MAARHWTPEQRARQAELFHGWKPWNRSTGARTPAGKAMSAQNAVRYSMRELLRETARTNKELLVYIKLVFSGCENAAPPNLDRTRADSLLDDLSQQLKRQ